MTYSITGRSKLIDVENNLWGFIVDNEDGTETLLSDKYFSSPIVIALDEITQFKGERDIKEGQKVKVTIETE